MKHFLFYTFILIFGNLSFSQAEKQLTTKFIEAPIKIDGINSEEIWKTAEIATDFIQNSPVPGAPDKQRTEVKVLYDNSAIYVSAVLYDNAMDSLMTGLQNRDNFGEADHFGVIIDTYGSSTIGFAFLVSSAGVQIDDLHTVDNIDNNWNAVWESAVKLYDDKWIVEIKIPFSAIRFPTGAQQNWKINFNRSSRRNRTDSFWNEFSPTDLNFLSQFGSLNGLKNIESPVRLSLSPYLSGYVVNFEGEQNYQINGGMDLKYGINDAFTVDMTLIPDFGQVKFDNQVLNLSPFEVRFDENRQFFTEGTELFNKGDLFYSRRIGQAPINRYEPYGTLSDSEEVISNPDATPLLNATKISGRTTSGLGVGFFNAVTRSTSAVIRDNMTTNERKFVTSPLANYNVFVLDQNLNNNSSVTLINTSVWRSGHTYDANVSAFEFDIYDNSETYNAYGNYSLSQIYAQVNNEFGHKFNLGAGKAAGKFQYDLEVEAADEKFNPNDIGFLYRNNYKNISAEMSYRTTKPFWNIYRSWYETYFTYSKLYNPNLFSFLQMQANWGATFKNFLSVGNWVSYSPEKNDYFESRIPGQNFIISESIGFGGFYSSDYSKKFALDIEPNYFNFKEKGRRSFNFEISPRFRFSDKFILIYNYFYENSNDELGAALDPNYSITQIDNKVVFGKRDRLNIENSIEANYIFNNKMGISFNLRHYWAKVEYDSFSLLNEDGTLSPTLYSGLTNDNVSLHNNNFNAFTIDMVYNWVFAPGSQLSIVWKNSIFNENENVDLNYFKNSNDLAGQSATNSLSFKFLYFLDYNNLKRKK